LEQKIVDFAIQLAIILFAISFHESAHAWSALKFGDTTARDLGRISLNPIRHIDPMGSVILPILLYVLSHGRFIFGAAKPTPVDLRNTRNPRLANLVVSAAGPLSNFMLAAIAIGVIAILRAAYPSSLFDLAEAVQGQRFAPGAVAPIMYLLWNFVVVNTLLGVFNLIPIPPLDGSGVLLSIGGPGVGRVIQTLRPFGFLLLLLLISTPFLGWLFRPFYFLVRKLVFGV
jgi:Zn-dependent protease